jgi:hypothetical protein
MATPVPIFIPYEHREHLAAHWLNQAKELPDAALIYPEELSELAASWHDLTDSERGLLVLACDLIRGGELP